MQVNLVAGMARLCGAVLVVGLALGALSYALPNSLGSGHEAALGRPEPVKPNLRVLPDEPPVVPVYEPTAADIVVATAVRALLPEHGAYCDALNTTNLTQATGGGCVMRTRFVNCSVRYQHQAGDPASRFVNCVCDVQNWQECPEEGLAGLANLPAPP